MIGNIAQDDLCMQMNGDFGDKACGVDLIIEFYSNDVEIAARSAAECESRIMRIRDELVPC